MPAKFQAVTEPRPPGRTSASASAISRGRGQIFTNNIKVAFYEFALGITLGLGTARAHPLNGIQFGAVGGLAVGTGNGCPFFELVTAHGMLELSC